MAAGIDERMQRARLVAQERNRHAGDIDGGKGARTRQPVGSADAAPGIAKNRQALSGEEFFGRIAKGRQRLGLGRRLQDIGVDRRIEQRGRFHATTPDAPAGTSLRPI